MPCSFAYYYEDRKFTEIGRRYGTSMLSYITSPEGNFMRGQLQLMWAKKKPVFVRENTILPIGGCTVCDTDGNVILTVTAVRNGNIITVKLNGESSSVKIEQIGTDCEFSVISKT